MTELPTFAYPRFQIGEVVDVPVCECGCGEPAEPYGTVLAVDRSGPEDQYLVQVRTKLGLTEETFNESDLRASEYHTPSVPWPCCGQRGPGLFIQVTTASVDPSSVRAQEGHHTAVVARDGQSLLGFLCPETPSTERTTQ